MPRVLLALVAAVVLGAATITFAAGRGGHAAPIAYHLAGTNVWPAGTQHAPNFALHDQNGSLVTRNGLRGHVWAITFIDSHCTQACPLEARDLAQVQRALGRTNPLTVILVSVLPRYDTPERVRAFARSSGLTGNWHWLLGTRSQLAPVWRAYGIWVLTGVSHTAAVYLVDQRGDIRVADAVPFRSDQLADSVRALWKTAALRPTSRR